MYESQLNPEPGFPGVFVGFILGVCISIAIMYMVIQSPAVGAYGTAIIKNCEEKLPRNQNCRIVAEPIPLEETDTQHVD